LQLFADKQGQDDPEEMRDVASIERELERLIGAGEFAPGSHLNETALASRFGVGRAAIREACRLLERTGLVTIVAHQGAFVRALGFDEILQLFDIRASLARLAGHEVAVNADAAGLRRLEELVAVMDEAAAARDPDTYVALNLQFHDLLYAATGNRRLAELDRQLGLELRLYRRHGLAHGGGLFVSNQEHRKILAAVKRGDREGAAELLEAHIRSGRDRFVRAMSATGELGLKPVAPPRRTRAARRG
jgi:DNA-binding GntR family transcriptional regulator